MTNRHQPAGWAQSHDVPEQWREQEFVDNWVTRDDGRQDQRGPMMEAAVSAAPFPTEQAIKVLDVGAGYGLLTKHLLERYPNAKVTLQDVSEPMFNHAKQRLAEYANRTVLRQQRLLEAPLDRWPRRPVRFRHVGHRHPQHVRRRPHRQHLQGHP